MGSWARLVKAATTLLPNTLSMIGGGSLPVFTALPWSQIHQPLSSPPQIKFQVRCESGRVVLTKQGHRFLSSLATNAAVGDPKAAGRLIRKFVAASPKSVALNALSYLLSPHNSHPYLSSLALPLYSKMTETSWFDWNSKLVAYLIALLNKQELYNESATLISEAVSKLKSRERDLVLFYCNLIESNSKHGSKQGFDQSYSYLSELVHSSSVYIKRLACKSMVSGLCEMGQPHEAEDLIEEMRMRGLKPSVFELRTVLYEYGKLGLFQDMQRILQKMESEGFKVDTICSNMVLSSYGAHNALPEMASWLQKMKESNIPFSIRTYNSVLNSCPMIMSMLKDSGSFPLSIVELIKILNTHEALLVKELIETSVLDDALDWNTSEAKLDLHGMHLSAAYLTLLQWIEEIRARFRDDTCVIPAEIVVVCGSGKHSSVRGESPVKDLVKEMMVQTGSPMRIDRKNIGCFVAKGKVMKNWLR